MFNRKGASSDPSDPDNEAKASDDEAKTSDGEAKNSDNEAKASKPAEASAHGGAAPSTSASADGGGNAIAWHPSLVPTVTAALCGFLKRPDLKSVFERAQSPAHELVSFVLDRWLHPLLQACPKTFCTVTHERFAGLLHLLSRKVGGWVVDRWMCAHASLTSVDDVGHANPGLCLRPCPCPHRLCVCVRVRACVHVCVCCVCSAGV